jgi:hypothetical protein
VEQEHGNVKLSVKHGQRLLNQCSSKVEAQSQKEIVLRYGRSESGTPEEIARRCYPKRRIVANLTVDVVLVHDSWWATRCKTGVHINNPSVAQLEAAKEIARLAGTYTVYVYRNRLTNGLSF